MKDKSPVEQLVLELCFCITQKRDALAWLLVHPSFIAV